MNIVSLKEIARNLMNGESIQLEVGDAMSPERIGEAYAVLNAMNAQLAEILELRGTAAWSLELQELAQNLSIQCGLFNAFIEISIQVHGGERPKVQ